MSISDEPKIAIAKLSTFKDVVGFDLYMANGLYGHYACDSSERFKESMDAALRDAADYGYKGILFSIDP